MIFSKKTLAASGIALIASAGIAAAGCMEDTPCFDTGFNVDISGSANFAGFGAGTFIGDEGGVLIEKDGYGASETTIDIAGALCGPECQDGTFTHQGSAGEFVSVWSGALGNQSGEEVVVVNQGGALTNVDFSFLKNQFNSDQ